jgi:Ca2+-binding RTX toxin-like protein
LAAGDSLDLIDTESLHGAADGNNHLNIRSTGGVPLTVDFRSLNTVDVFPIPNEVIDVAIVPQNYNKTPLTTVQLGTSVSPTASLNVSDHSTTANATYVLDTGKLDINNGKTVVTYPGPFDLTFSPNDASANTITVLNTDVSTTLLDGAKGTQYNVLASGGELTITGSHANDVINLGASAGKVQSIGDVTISNTSAPVTTIMNDLGDTAVRTVGITHDPALNQDGIDGLLGVDVPGLALFIHDAPKGQQNRLLIAGGSGGDTFLIRNTPSSRTTIWGGSGADVYKFGNQAILNGGSIGDAGGANWLDYSAYTTTVFVNLSANIATGTSGVSGVHNVRGGSGNDVLAGDSTGNILVGGAGDDLLAGGTGPNLLIGGAGKDTIYAGSAGVFHGGTNADIIVSGTTCYDNDNATLLSIEGVWKRTDWEWWQKVYYTLGHLYTGTPGTVFDDGQANTVFRGTQAKLDLLYLGQFDTPM